MPTRLLDVWESRRLRVVTNEREQNATLQKQDSYIAMSHCWGAKSFLMLSSATSEMLFSGFNEDMLPQSFQDAVPVTRQLGIPFLWIDSLCIFQDSANGWEKESQQMGEVYSCAYCTFAATGARDSSEGFFFHVTI